VQVTGNVTVGTGASLVIGLNSTIAGHITAKGCNFVGLVSEGNEEVDGNVQILGCTGNPSFLSPGNFSAIYGNLQCLNNTGPCSLESAIVGGSVQFMNNVSVSGSLNKLEANQISRNLQCQSNNPAPTNGGSVNTVAGSKQGQCVGL
jgi:hypothetical protein